MTWLLTLLQTLKGLFGLGEKVMTEVHDSQQRKAGADAVTVKSQATALQNDQAAAQDRSDIGALSDADLNAELRTGPVAARERLRRL